MRSLLPGVLVALALGIAGCGGSSSLLDPGGANGSGPDGAWVLGSADPTIAVPDGARITLTVETQDGTTRVTGTAACNGYGGEVTLDGAAWTARDGGWSITEMGCEAPLQQAEAAYMQALTTVDAWSRDGEPATLRLTGPDVTLEFAALPILEPATFTGTDWVVDSYLTGADADGTTSSGVVGTPAATVRFADDGMFTLFSGCRDFAGAWTASGDEVQLTSWGQTSDSRGVAADGSLTCGDEAVAQEARVLDVVEGGFTTVTSGHRLTLTNGSVGLSLRPAE